MPLFTYRSPMRRMGLVVVLAGAALLILAMWQLITGVVAAGTAGGGAGAILGAFLQPILEGILAVAMIVFGGVALFTTWFGPSSMDDYEGPGDDIIWGRCPRCGQKNGPRATHCAACGRVFRGPL